MHKKNMLSALAAIALAADAAAFGQQKRYPVNVVPSDPIIPTPSGAKQYFFNIHGEFSTEKMLRSELVFKCVSINDKNAVRKFEKWKLKQNRHE